MSPIITVYAEATPNPESVKFVFNKGIIESGSFDYQDPAAAQESPLAYELFKFNFVKGVYISQNFVTITKAEGSLWAELIPIVRSFLKEYIEAGNEVVPEGRQKLAEPVFEEDDDETVKRIKEILAANIKPVVEMDGGNIEFKSFDDGIVTLSLRGSCSGCPSSTVTLKAGIESLLKRLVPGVNEVVAEAL